MRQATFAPIVILSAHTTSSDSFLNALRTESMAKDIGSLGLKFKRARGVFKGVSEDCFIIPVGDDSQVKILLGLASHYKQECVMFSDKDRTCQYMYPCGKVFELGTLQAISEEEAKHLSGYTEVNGKFYAVV